MRESSDRRTRIWTVAVLGLAMLGFVAWIFARAASSPAGVQIDAVGVASADGNSESPPAPTLERGTRVAETTAEVESQAKGVRTSVTTTPEQAPAARPVAPGMVRLFGNVTSASGEPLDRPPARVEINGPFDTRNVEVVGGAYAIEDVRPGNYQVHCSAPGLRDETRPVFLALGETEHREDFVLTTSWSVAIRLVTTDGRNFLDLDKSEAPSEDTRLNVVAVADPPPAQWSPRSFEFRAALRNSRYLPRTRGRGVEGDPDDTCSGSLDVFLPPPVHLAAEIQGVVLGSTRVDVEEKVVTIEIPLARIRGFQCSLRGQFVKSEDGSPIARVPAELFGPSAGRPIHFEADDDGTFRKSDLFPGTYTLMTSTEDRGLLQRPVELLPGVENDLGTIALGPPMHIRGRFVDAAGHAVKTSVFVTPYDPEHPLDTMNTIWDSADVKDEGRFEVAGVAPRVYALISANFVNQGSGYCWTAPVVVDVTHGSVDGLVIEAKPATSVTLHPVSTEARQLAYWIVSDDGILCQRGAFRDRGDSAVLLGEGRFRLCVGRDASSVREIPFTVGKETVKVEVEP